MNTRRRSRRNREGEALQLLLATLIILFGLLALTGCATTAPVCCAPAVHDTTYISRTHTDSIYVRDSIFVREKGDTIFRCEYRYRYRDRVQRDTIYKSVSDTIRLTEFVEKELSTIDKARMFLGDLFAGVLLAGVVILLIKRL